MRYGPARAFIWACWITTVSRGDCMGALGLAINRPKLVLRAETADELRVEGSEIDRITAYAERFISRYGVPKGAHLNLLTAIPAHVGLGSGTQLGLAVGTALARLAGLKLSVADIAVAVERGVHSGIGIATFQHGGFVLDGGHRILPAQSAVSDESRQSRQIEKSRVPPLLFRHPMPVRLAFCDRLFRIWGRVSAAKRNTAHSCNCR